MYSHSVTAIVLVLLCSIFSASAQQSVQQPTSKDIARTVAVIKADKRCPQLVQFVTCGPKDAPKHPIVAPLAKSEILTIIRDRAARRIHEISTDLATGKVTEWKRVDGMQPMVAGDDYDSASAIVRRHAAWQRSIKRRGLDTNDVVIDTWASGIPSSANMGRVVRAITYVRGNRKTNLYDRPIEGLVCNVSLDAKRVLEFHDVEPAPIAPVTDDFNEVYKKSGRKGLAPMSIQQNASAAIKVIAGEVQWQNWLFTPVMHPREGLVLHNVRVVDGKTIRKVAHRLALAEMVVPYGDTSRFWYWRNAFDVGEYGVGNLTIPLVMGSDLPTNARTLNAAFARYDGSVLEIKNAIGLYERDCGVLWKHADPFTGENRVRRGRELVVTHTTVVGNYDYSISYILSLDGSIHVDVGLSGILLPKGVPDTTYNLESSGGQMYGALVAKNIVAPSHQHYFSFRLDMDVDGDTNRISEVDQWSPPSDENRYSNAIKMDDYELLFEKEAMCDVSPQMNRCWRVSSASHRNGLRGPTSYMLVPGSTSRPFLDTNNIVRKRAGFVEHQLWVTQQHDNELYSAGDYPNQSNGGDGLPTFVKNNESLRERDVVLWYNLGITHQPRPEDWPVMPMVHAGFTLRPDGFFDRNPALDMPPTSK